MSLHNAQISEPIAGYILRERIGAGGYGEVWKADAPGGLVKAVKLVYGYLNEERATTELKAFNRIKQVRHPFLLSLERIEIVEGQLVIVTELADSSMKEWYEECRKAGLPGIPRDELIGYLRDAADALDYMSSHFSLQHLDVKPENLLMVAGHIKVGDFGLVKDLRDGTASLMQGMTPIYAPPEVFDGRATSQSDQYSLAIVFQEMLTGQLPFPGRTLAQLASQHLHSPPRLNMLPASDRPIIGRALSKDPAGRFKDCREMVESLAEAGRAAAAGKSTKDEAEIDTKSVLTKATAVFEGGKKTPPADDGSTQAWPGGVDDEADDDEFPRRPRVVVIPRFKPPPKAVVPSCGEVIEAQLETSFTELPPVDVADATPRLRPTLFVAVGGAAGRALVQLRARMTERFGDLDAGSAMQFLWIDTDTAAMTDLMRKDESPPLRPHEVLQAPLRRTQDYRANSKRFLQWLSRRWLYNIPRSQLTEGLRPLGRLAFVDHFDTIRRQLEGAIDGMLATEATAALADSAGCEVAADEPRVVVLASISGGTGGGMVFDVAYTIRQLLADRSLTDRFVTGVLLHSTDWHATNRELAITNAYGSIAELYHYLRDGGKYPGDPICGIPPRTEDGAPFAETYLVHLGDSLSNEDFQQQLDNVAEYVYREAATAASLTLDACRHNSIRRSTQSKYDVFVRTFGVVHCRVAPSDATAAVESLCKTVLGELFGSLDGAESRCGAASSGWSKRGSGDALSTRAAKHLAALVLPLKQEETVEDAGAVSRELVSTALDEALVPCAAELVATHREAAIEAITLAAANALGTQPEAIVAEVFAAARQKVADAARRLDLAALVRSQHQDEQGTIPLLPAWVERATPCLPGGVAARRLIVCASADSSAAELCESISTLCHRSSNLVTTDDAGLALIYETEQVSLAQLAAGITEYRSEYGDVARRLHTRVDIEWTPMPDVRPAAAAKA
ncbi:MAG: tubulin-like doman-containing protein [Pirellulales bacterium]